MTRDQIRSNLSNRCKMRLKKAQRIHISKDLKILKMNKLWTCFMASLFCLKWVFLLNFHLNEQVEDQNHKEEYLKQVQQNNIK